MSRTSRKRRARRQGRPAARRRLHRRPRTTRDEAVLNVAFGALLTHGEPLTVPRLAELVATRPDELELQLEALRARGWIRRDDDGSVVGSRGLSVEATRHELWLNGERRFTWCAYDTIGILAALRSDGRIRSQTPLGEPVELEVVGGRPTATDEIVLFLPERQVASVVDEWCPLTNFFLDEVAAQRWASERDIDGRVISLAEASELGAREWREAALSARDARSP